MTVDLTSERGSRVPRPTGFAQWRARLDRNQIPPVIAVIGSRGKTSVVRAIESILREGGYRFASWTNRGVEIEEERQRGELGPWARALTRLAAGGLDVAIQELDWATVQSLGPTIGSFPITAISNLCANNETCLVAPEILQARRAIERIRASGGAGRRVILNADDYVVSADNGADVAARMLVGISADRPVMRQHLRDGGDACYVAKSTIMVQEDRITIPIVDTRWLDWTRGGSISFAVRTALMATAVARSCGLPPANIAAGLAAHQPRAELMPGSFNVFDVGFSKVVVDRPMPSWFLRASLRAAANLAPGRQLRVAGPMADVPLSDLPEVGRLLGRNGGLLIVHGNWSRERLASLRQGISANDVPPLVFQASDERSAIHQGLGMLQPDDVMLVLAEDAEAAVRVIARCMRRQTTQTRDTAGAA